MAKNKQQTKAEKMISEIFAESRDMTDIEYCEFLEEIASACDDAAEVKRQEMNG